MIACTAAIHIVLFAFCLLGARKRTAVSSAVSAHAFPRLRAAHRTVTAARHGVVAASAMIPATILLQQTAKQFAVCMLMRNTSTVFIHIHNSLLFLRDSNTFCVH
jgi:hypothetical protein